MAYHTEVLAVVNNSKIHVIQACNQWGFKGFRQTLYLNEFLYLLNFYKKARYTVSINTQQKK